MCDLFFVKSADVGFADRQKNIFDLLNVAEKEKNERQQKEGGTVMEISENESMDVEPTDEVIRPHKRKRSPTKQFRGKESIFKKPAAVHPKFKVKNIPDFQRNPHKWVKYTLADVSQEDMSNQSNTAAAFDFLQEVKKRKSLDSGEESISDDSKVVFRPRSKPVSSSFTVSELKNEISEDQDEKKAPTFRSSKIIMPEYVVGKEKKQKKKVQRPSPCTDTGKEIKLLHLLDEEEEAS